MGGRNFSTIPITSSVSVRFGSRFISRAQIPHNYIDRNVFYETYWPEFVPLELEVIFGIVLCWSVNSDCRAERSGSFFFGLATAPAHVEDNLNDSWLEFAQSSVNFISLREFLLFFLSLRLSDFSLEHF